MDKSKHSILFPKARRNCGRLADWGRLPGQEVEVWAQHASRRLGSARAFLDFMAEPPASHWSSLSMRHRLR
ncbi:hypothetical protein [Shewanella salipaludis]|uniref:Uncharacterized protein n=1 Tax=Shewanella salipaludis TaxID=2723052 RepID=A0A972JKV2_9GAMM|nr:hypothetical protein [Shewanella salipaludis]NMH66590.1 hypothetical protein [Shewanella salipaludis]